MSELPAELVRIRGFLDRLARARAKGHPWLADFQHAVFTDPDLDHGLVSDDPVLAKNALAGIVFRLYRDKPPESIRSSMTMLGIELREG